MPHHLHLRPTSIAIERAGATVRLLLWFALCGQPRPLQEAQQGHEYAKNDDSIGQREEYGFEWNFHPTILCSLTRSVNPFEDGFDDPARIDLGIVLTSAVVASVIALAHSPDLFYFPISYSLHLLG